MSGGDNPSGSTGEPFVFPRRGLVDLLEREDVAIVATRTRARQLRAGRYLERDRRDRELDFTGQAEWGSESTFANGATGDHSVVAGGVFNAASGEKSTIGGGQLNVANSTYATVSGGSANLAADDGATVGGGRDNTAEGVDSVVSGGEENTATADDATIGGGTDNYVTAPLATIGGGGPWSSGTEFAGNRARGRGSTVGGGLSNEASGDHSTVGGGSFNAATGTGGEGDRTAGWATVSGGADNSASGDYATVGGGSNNGATGEFSTVAGGKDNESQAENATVPGGLKNRASGESSLAAGDRARARHDNTFVWSDGNEEYRGEWDETRRTPFESTDESQFLVQAAGGVGIGTAEPRCPLHVHTADEPLGGDSPGDHVALIEGPPNHRGTLALKSGQGGQETGAHNYATFFDTNDVAVGAVESDNGGVRLKSGGADYAELLPLRDADDSPAPGDVVGVHAGEISRETAGADRAMVVSAAPIVLGNAPPGEADADTDADTDAVEAVAFVGQVATKVAGPVESGDVIVPSGAEDGTGVAVDPADWRPGAHGPPVGQAWETDPSAGVTTVTVAVGLDGIDGVPARVERYEATIDDQAARIDGLREENARLRDRVASLEAHEATIRSLEEEIDDLRSRLASVSERLRGVESARGAGDPSTAD